MRDALERTSGLRERLFTPTEQATLEELRVGRGEVAADSAAAQMFAVKEAVMKSLGVGCDTVPFNAIEVDLGKPAVGLYGAGAATAAELGATRFELTLELVEGPEGVLAVAEVLARLDTPR